MTVLFEELPLHPLLGRNVKHDSRSLAYALPVLPKSAIKSAAWGRQVPIFDQGQVGSCTGNAAAGWVATNGAARTGLKVLPDGTPVDEKLAVSIYSDATKIDSARGSYPPTDTGSDGISVAKVLKTRGLSGDYLHAFSIDAVYSALQSGPGMAGTVWYQSMFTPAADGRIPVTPKSGVAGGHEYVISKLDVTSTGVVERIWMDNSWNSSWGVGGSSYFAPADFIKLLAAQGDFTVPSAAVLPGPTPAPSDADAALWASVSPWAAASHSGANETAAKNLKAWAKVKGYTT